MVQKSCKDIDFAKTEQILSVISQDRGLSKEKRAAVREAMTILRTSNHKPGQIGSWTSILKQTRVGTAVIVGYLGKGKSALAWQLAEIAHNAGRAVYVIGMPKKTQKYAPGWAKHAKDLRKIPKGAFVLVDEAALRYSCRRSQSDNNVALGGLNALARQRDQLIVFVAHTSRMLEIEAVLDCKMLIYRKPSMAHIMFERRELAPWTQEARDAIMSQKQTIKWAYVIDLEDGKKGLVKCHLPGFWSEELSKAWAELDVEELMRAMKTK
ncbi:MAG: hypothetical protein PHO67_07880 [Candidatus Omnitrophica bacterium]|nr:hypothetical protein [Candidatus Omnitrophota bacterium]